MTPLNIYLMFGLLVATSVNLAQVAMAMQAGKLDLLKITAIGLLAFVAWPVVIVLVLFQQYLYSQQLHCGYCRQAFKPSEDAALRKHVQSCQQNPLVQMIATQYSQIEPMTNALNRIWGLMYDDPKSWENPNQVVEEVCGQIVALEESEQTAGKLADMLQLLVDIETMVELDEFAEKHPREKDWVFSDLKRAVSELLEAYHGKTASQPEQSP